MGNANIAPIQVPIAATVSREVHLQTHPTMCNHLPKSAAFYFRTRTSGFVVIQVMYQNLTPFLDVGLRSAFWSLSDAHIPPMVTRNAIYIVSEIAELEQFFAQLSEKVQ